MDYMNGCIDLKKRVELYRNYDEARQQHLEEVAEQFEFMTAQLKQIQGDLDIEREARRYHVARADAAEQVLGRNQFALVLVDGDGYIFRDEFLQEASESGGSRAANELYTNVQHHLKDKNLIDSDVQIIVNVYANKSGLARALCDADLLHAPSQLEHFFCSFNQSRSLFQFIDCGYGKERADTKLRDTYRFYAYNGHCKHIFLACCHDNGYVAELDKYRYDPIVKPKTTLVYGAQSARQYSSLPFAATRFDTVFSTSPLPVIKKEVFEPAPQPTARKTPSVDDNVTSPPSSAPTTWSSITSGTTSVSTKVPIRALPMTASPTLNHSDVAGINSTVSNPKNIPVNRNNQRVDLKMRAPTMQELNEFEHRIKKRKLCNNYHLGGGCPAPNCKFDHDPIDSVMKNTLKYKARSIPCENGPSCRQADCFYGHQCPWGRDKCGNAKCPFIKAGMHNITDIEPVKHEKAWESESEY